MKWFHIAGTLVACSGGVVGFVGCSDSSGGGGPATDAGNDTGTTPTDSGDNADTSGNQDAGGDTSTTPDTGVPGVEVHLQYGSCPPFVPCGGDPKGKWAVTGGCVSETIFDPAKKNCPGLTESNVVFKAKGVIDANATNVDQKTQIFFSAKVNIPRACVDAIPGATCGLVALYLKSAQAGSTSLRLSERQRQLFARILGGINRVSWALDETTSFCAYRRLPRLDDRAEGMPAAAPLPS